jgi:hypothetical protein
MRVLFAGPSLHGTEWACDRERVVEGVRCRGPAAQGDITRAVLEGATAIGLVDGRFEDVAAPWHKEILYALGEGVQMLGAASMGALRAAECAPFGMIGIGIVFERYASGELVDDAAVAQLHAPPELGSFPLTEALVNVEASVERFSKLRAITHEEAERIEASARALFFKERAWPTILNRAGLDAGARANRLTELVRRCRVDVKREDALVLARYLAYVDPVRQSPPNDWCIEQTPTWMMTLQRASAAARPVQ